MLAPLFFSALLASTPAMQAPATPAMDFGAHASIGADRQAIEALLNAYTRAVTQGDEAAFQALLLDPQIPFSGVGATIKAGASSKRFDDRDYKSFQDQIFKSGKAYVQSFHNVHILQDGPLAQVSLDFVTQDAKTGQGGYGWKTLQLLKVDGQWKIASEFYTGHPLPKRS